MTFDSTNSDSTSIPTPSLSDAISPVSRLSGAEKETPPLSTNSSEDSLPPQARLPRPRLPSRKSSGTMIIPRDSPKVELRPEDEEYDEDDVRNLSPRRTSEVTEKLGEDARRHLIEQAKQLQASLMAIVDRVETVKVEHEKLEGGNKFLQSYIGELIQTSKITSAHKKGKSRGTK
ncbi:hypothetical protein AAFC00_003149 [Neodothiora populina]|uniref:BZIP transcription factor n=1 Tax=Neodothiora populina TaxID=2781224 RepID=A0ABR3PAT1_9PEZI